MKQGAIADNRVYFNFECKKCGANWTSLFAMCSCGEIKEVEIISYITKQDVALSKMFGSYFLTGELE